MSVKGKDGAWTSATEVVRLECSCGHVEVSRWPMNDREIEAFIESHLREKHGGRDRA
jgi:hypothetical protein